jgi:hypothetical protein
VQGNTGVAGATGIQGSTGVQGLTGATGVQGIQGQTGVQGSTGVQGFTGIFGFTGVAGATGIQGITGLLGQTGVQGITGIGAGLHIKSGVVAAASFSGTPLTYSVTFTNAFPNTSYSITITGGTDVRVWSYSGKTASGFTINSNSITALTGEVSWQATTIGDT